MKRLVLVALTIAIALFVVLRAARKGEGKGADKTHGALERNYEFAGRLLRGSDPYASPQLHAPYPPSYGIVLSPLRLFPLQTARVAWAIIQLACLAALLVLLRTWYRTIDAKGPPIWVPLLAIVLVARYLSRDTSGGGGNLVWGTLVFFAVLRPGEPPGSDEKPWRGALLGIVLGAKPTPVLFLPWLWWRGRKRTLTVAIVVATILHVSPLLTLGVNGWLDAYGRWIDGVIAYSKQTDLFAMPSHDFPPFSWMHQSLRFAVTRFLATVPAEHVLDSPLFFQGLGLEITTVAITRRVLEAAIAATTLFALWRARTNRSTWTDIHATSLLASATLLLSPIVWKSYHLWLLPFFYACLAHLATPREDSAVSTKRRRRERVIGMAVYFVLCGLSSELLLGQNGKEVMQSLYVVTAGALWAWSLALRDLLRPHESNKPDSQRS
ncbi:MAG: DUF2029 domain-containing protein [Planctomycetes bacterium]|nr:DUF2029 domain-containing protein [Planctomycetota bacterium]